jgi:hypothetical protein
VLVPVQLGAWHFDVLRNIVPQELCARSIHLRKNIFEAAYVVGDVISNVKRLRAPTSKGGNLRADCELSKKCPICASISVFD